MISALILQVSQEEDSQGFQGPKETKVLFSELAPPFQTPTAAVKKGRGPVLWTQPVSICKAVAGHGPQVLGPEGSECSVRPVSLHHLIHLWKWYMANTKALCAKHHLILLLASFE